MAYCTKCGAEVPNGAAYCPKCGAPIDPEFVKTDVVGDDKKPLKGRDDTIMTIALVLCIISIVVTAPFIIPLAWTIPMTIHLNKCLKNNEKISVAFKICTLIFLNTIAGILLLVGDPNE